MVELSSRDHEDGAHAGDSPTEDSPVAGRRATAAPVTIGERVSENPMALKDAPAAVAPATVPAASAPVATTAPAASRRSWLRPALFLLLPIALVAGGYWYVVGGAVMATDNAYVRADMVGVSTDVSGIVKQIDVHENQMVAVGDVLFRLDDEPFQIALRTANAQIGIVAASLNALKASYRDMQAQIQQAGVDVDFYGREADRQGQLVGRNFASKSTFDESERNLQSAKQKVASLTEQLAGIAANLAGNPDIPIEQHPSYVEAVARRDEAARQLAHTVVKAPIAGTVTNVPSLQPGQYLDSSTAAFSIVAVDRLWIEANPKETELTYVQPGQAVSITVDTYPDHVWHGTVESVSPASSSSFALLPAQNTSGNWVKVVQRIPMRVRIDPSDGNPPLRAGMSVVLDVDTGHPRGLPTFLTNLFRSGTSSRG